MKKKNLVPEKLLWKGSIEREWEREEFWNSHSPNSISSRTCSGEATISSLKPATYIPRFIYKGNYKNKTVFIRVTIVKYQRWCIDYLNTFMDLEFPMFRSQQIIYFLVIDLHVGHSQKKLPVSFLKRERKITKLNAHTHFKSEKCEDSTWGTQQFCQIWAL